MNVAHRRIVRLAVVAAVSLTAACGGTSTEDRSDGAGGDTTTTVGPSATEPTSVPTIPTDGSPGDTVSGLVDPLPAATAAGAVTCRGCPEVTGITDFAPDVADGTTLSLSGVAGGAVGDGTFHVVSSTGQSVGGPIPTDPDGSFDLTVPLFCGDQLVKLAWQNTAGTAGVVFTPTTGSCSATSLRITLTWDDLGDDFELHLVRAGGTINDRTDDGSGSNDCTWNTCIHDTPDWGVSGDPSDDPVKDIDDTGSYGPENITLTNPEPITYTVLVEHWGPGDPGADGEVIINVAEGDTVAVPVTDLPTEWVAVIAAIEFPAGTITPIGERYDCTAEWGFNGGCGATLPVPREE
jgi:hypothetical protein